MANFRTSADYVDAILNRAGEPTSGTSAYEADALTYLNKVQQTVIAGGNIFDLQVDEPWIWAKAKSPIIIELQPKYTTGTLLLTNGDEAGTFSSAPAASLEGWHLNVTGDTAYYKIMQHTAGATAFELDGNYLGSSAAAATYRAIKLDYDIVSTHMYVNTNTKIDFTDGTLTKAATLIAGSYTPAELAAHVQTKLLAVGASALTCTYSTTTRKFTITSDRLGGGGGVFVLLGASGSNQANSALPLLGFDDADTTNAASVTSTYIFGGISRMFEPFRVYRQSLMAGSIYGIDQRELQEEWPINSAQERIPTRFAKIAEDQHGAITVRFNGYPTDTTKVEVEHIPLPRDVKDSTASAPLIPRKYSDLLEYGAAFFILTDKSDDTAQTYFQLAKQQLQAMQKANKAELRRTGQHFGEVIPREDMLLRRPRRFTYGYDRGDY